MYSGRTSTTSTEDLGERIGKKILHHLLMFQYYRDLKYHDESIISIFRNPEDVKPGLRVEFLQEWDEKHSRNNTAEWELENYDNGEIDQNQFVEKFARFWVDLRVMNAAH